MPARFTRPATSALTAALLALGALPAARAQIVYTGPVDLTLTASASDANAYIFFAFGTGGSNGSARIDSDTVSGDQFVFVNTGSPDFIAGVVALDSPPHYVETNADAFTSNLPLGASIDGTHASFGTFGILNANNGNDANWAPGSSGYLGFSFIDDATTNYGWARVSYNSDLSLTLHDFAYEASGGAILAGATGSAIPEPSTYAAFAGLLAVIVAFQAKRCRQRSGGLLTA